MYFIYNLITHIVWFYLETAALFNAKIRLFVRGRKDTWNILGAKIASDDQVIWVHAASLGEFEQGLPIIEKLKREYTDHKILVTFFSPSGYEIKKDTAVADAVCYLPMDTQANAIKFLQLARPKIAIFVKYEIWPNYLREIKKNNIPILLISAIFKKKQIYFKGYGGFMRKALSYISHFFVQDESSKQLLESIDLTNCTVSGDTRFDRVSEILARDNRLSFMDQFKQDKICFVAGSTWPEDEVILVDFINSSEKQLKYLLAPHDIKADHISKLKLGIDKKTILYSEAEDSDLSEFEVLILDTIGLLTKIYSYADIAYVGGGFATGLHNTLEPAVFGIPVLIGPNYHGFREAENLVQKQGIIVINNNTDFSKAMDKLVDDSEYREKTGETNALHVAKNTGASIQIIGYIRKLM